MPAKRFVVVTTSHRGVFGGYLNGQVSEDSTVVTLKDARMCLYWSAQVKGVLGLAAGGPVKGCRVGPAVKSLTLTGVTSIVETSAEAEKAWSAQLW